MCVCVCVCMCACVCICTVYVDLFNTVHSNYAFLFLVVLQIPVLKASRPVRTQLCTSGVCN